MQRGVRKRNVRSSYRYFLRAFHGLQKMPDGGKCIMINDAQTAVELMAGIDQLARGLVSSKPPLSLMFSINQRTDGVFQLFADSWGRLLLDGLNLEVRDLQLHFPFAEVSPYVYEFLQAGQSLDRGQLGLALSGTGAEVCNLASAQLSLMVRLLESQYGRVEFKKNIGDYRRPINKNIASVKGYVDKLLERYASLHVVVVDLFANDHTDSVSGVYEFDRVIAANKQFFKAVKVWTEQDGLVGYAWTLNYSGQCGAKYSYVFFFDGYLWSAEEEQNLVKSVANFWRQCYPETGASVVWNTVDPQQGGDTVAEACGILKGNDRDKKSKLEALVSHLFRHQILLKSMANYSGRSFGKGQVDKRRSLEPKPVTDYQTIPFLSGLPKAPIARN